MTPKVPYEDRGNDGEHWDDRRRSEGVHGSRVRDEVLEAAPRHAGRARRSEEAEAVDDVLEEGETDEKSGDRRDPAHAPRRERERASGHTGAVSGFVLSTNTIARKRHFFVVLAFADTR